jgi:hypothetical protein
MRWLLNLYHWGKYYFQRWLLIKVFRWKEAEKEWPEVNQICRLKWSPRLTKYVIPPEFPDFADTEEEKRRWYIFLMEENGEFSMEHSCRIWAQGSLWKPVKSPDCS